MKTALRSAGLAAVWLGVLIGGSVLEFKGLLPENTFPRLEQYLPDFPGLSLAPLRSLLPAKESPAPPGPAVPAPAGTKALFNQDRDRALADVMRKLRARKETVRIVHIGDSILWAETVTSALRRSLQKEYGNGGRGYVSLQDTSETTLKDHTNLTRSGFSLSSIPFDFYRGKPDERLGFLGRSFEPQSQGAQSIHKTDVPFDEVRVFLRSKPGGTAPVRVTAEITNQGRTEKFERTFEGSCGEVRFPAPGNEVRLSFAGSPLVDGVFLERANGVSYSVVVRMGIHQTWMQHIPEANSVCGWRQLKPDLVIFQFALNESATIDTGLANYTADKYREDLRTYFKSVRKFLPSTPVLMVGPVDRIKDKNGVLVPVPAQNAVREVQREIASEFNVLFFDPQASPDTPLPAQMMARGMLLSDYLHLSPGGGDFLGNLIYRETFGGSVPQTEAASAPEPAVESRTITFPSARYAWFLLLVLFVFHAAAKLPYFRLIFVTIASCYFYASWEAWALGLLLFSCSLDYTMGRLIERADRRIVRFLLLCVSIGVNVSLLVFFKYFTFLARSINSLLDPASQLPVYQVLLPPGISFYTFQSLSYTIDVYRGGMKAERNPLRLFFFVSFFPQLVAGPIVRAHDFLLALKKNIQHFRVTTVQFQEAVFLIARGLTKKIGADWLALYAVDRVIQNPSMFTSTEILAAFYAYALQIYGDFSGYTDIACGSARLFGLRLTVNFHRPYQSASITEFWRRWHISLGSWFRDYLYISLGGNRTGVYRNLFITMAVAGIWHGAGWNFLFWGLFYGIMLMFERAAGLDGLPKNPVVRVLRVILTFHLVWGAWVLFRVGSMDTFQQLLAGVMKGEFHAPNLSWTAVIVMIAGYALHFTPKSWIDRAGRTYGRLHWTLAGAALAACTVLLSKAAVQHAVPFIYFQF